MGFAEIMIDEERAPIGFFGFVELAGVMICEAEIVPSLSVGGDECGGKLEFFNCLSVFAFVDEFFTLEESLGTGGSATGCDEKQNRRDAEQVTWVTFVTSVK